MRLIIENIHKMLDSEYHQGRFVCTKAEELETTYRFQFCDHNWPSVRYIWVEVRRNGRWDDYDKKWYYTLNYPNASAHFISADWFSFPVNVNTTFEEALKQC